MQSNLAVDNQTSQVARAYVVDLLDEADQAWSAKDRGGCEGAVGLVYELLDWMAKAI